MPPTATETPAEPAAKTDREFQLLNDLQGLGAQLSESHLPAPGEIRHVLGAVVRYLALGKTDAPVIPEGEQPAPVQDARDVQIAELQSRLDAIENPVEPVGESPVAPQPADAGPPVAPAGDPRS